VAKRKSEAKSIPTTDVEGHSLKRLSETKAIRRTAPEAELRVDETGGSPEPKGGPDKHFTGFSDRALKRDIVPVVW
jgi:hypothetical protein